MKEINLVEGKLVAPEGMKVAIVASRFNEIIVNKLLGGASGRCWFPMWCGRCFTLFTMRCCGGTSAC